MRQGNSTSSKMHIRVTKERYSMKNRFKKYFNNRKLMYLMS